MKKILCMCLVVCVLILTGCEEDEPEANDVMSYHQTLAFSAYFAHAIMDNQDIITSDVVSHDYQQLINLQDGMAYEDIVELYFSKLKVFLDHDWNQLFTVEEVASSHEAYEKEIIYTLDDQTYSVFYTIEMTGDDQEEGTFSGLLVMSGEEYPITGGQELDDEDEYELWFEMADEQGDIVLFEVEVDDEEQEFDVSFERDEEAYEASIVLEQDEIEVQLTIEQHAIELEFEKEMINGNASYTLEYERDGEEILFTIIEVIDEEGRPRYQFIIKDPTDEV